MFRGSTAMGKEHFKNVPETKLYFYVACLREVKDMNRMVVMGPIMNMDQGIQGELNNMNRMAVMGAIMNMDQGTHGEGRSRT